MLVTGLEQITHHTSTIPVPYKYQSLETAMSQAKANLWLKAYLVSDLIKKKGKLT